jgi:hypothetical protein
VEDNAKIQRKEDMTYRKNEGTWDYLGFSFILLKSNSTIFSFER